MCVSDCLQLYTGPAAQRQNDTPARSDFKNPAAAVTSFSNSVTNGFSFDFGGDVHTVTSERSGLWARGNRSLN